MPKPYARPEDRRRAEPAPAAAPTCCRSEAFAEDLIEAAEAQAPQASLWQHLARRVSRPDTASRPRLQGL
ncbi:hypothetical protein RA210_U50286 [Rubrivivax sp. A210]|uniref:hypothetical protein n=1 Tax=Rubrivivax sp. A210 TaxID=2772301 RepID=UPI001918F32E|nr:hypothetical protein [Rubrivivax sp. A210]CAD5374335.1 hypothetical protein RA210_U50286 [Rubrivivax sp. A210]